MENWTEEQVAAHLARFKPKWTMETPKEVVAERFNAKWKKNNSNCWIWRGAKAGSPYGKMRVDNITLNAHAVSWLLHKGEVPNGMQVLHKCDVMGCVNPEHLFLGTQQDNIRDAVYKNRHKHCVFHGINHPSAKLTEIQVSKIRKDNRFLKIIAREYGISIAQVSRIRRSESWCETQGEDNTPFLSPDLEQNSSNEFAPKDAPEKVHTRFSMVVHHRSRRLADATGRSHKAAVDGIVGGGLLPDDSPVYVKEIKETFEQRNNEETIIELWEFGQ